MEEGRGVQRASGREETTAPDLLGQEARNRSGMGGLTAYILGMYGGDGFRGRGESPVDVVEISGSGETSDGHVKIYFGGSKGAAGNGKPEGVMGVREGRRVRLLTYTGEGEARDYWYAGMKTGNAQMGG